MIQSTPVVAWIEADDAVIWPITSSNRLTSTTGITRMVMICSRDGYDDITLDSFDEPRAYDFDYITTVRGQQVSAIKWIPGRAMGELFQDLGLWRAKVYLYDEIYQDGLYHGEFMLLIKSVRLYDYYTSRPYPLLAIESLDLASSLRSLTTMQSPTDLLDLSSVILSGELRALLVTYTYWPFEGADLSSSPLSGELRAVLVTYTNWPFEGADLSSSILSGDIDQILITYTNWPFEGADLSSSILSGSLT